MKDNKTLANEMKQKNEVALGVFMQQNRDWVHSKAYSILKDHQDAEEATLDVFSKIWRKVHLWDDSKSTFNSWFGTFVKYTILDAYRIRKSFSERTPWFCFEGDPDVASIPIADPNARQPLDVLIEDEVSDRILDMIALSFDDINPNHRLAWRLRAIEKYSIPEIMRIMNTKRAGTVKVWIYRCKQKLKENMANLMEDLR